MKRLLTPTPRHPVIRPRTRWERMAAYPVKAGTRRRVMSWRDLNSGVEPAATERWLERVQRYVGQVEVEVSDDFARGTKVVQWRLPRR